MIQKSIYSAIGRGFYRDIGKRIYIFIINKTGLIVVDDDGNGPIVFVSDGICIGLY